MKKLSSLLLLTSMCMFTMSMHAQTPVGYTLFGSNPDGYTDLTASVTAQAIGTAVWDANILTGKGLPGRICETSNYLQMSFNAATTMTLTENYAIHIKLAKVGEAAGDVQLSFCKGGWNAVRVSYIIPNASTGTDATDIVLNYADRNTGTPKYNLPLSERRVKAVKKAIMERGIAEDRILTDFKGDTVQPFELPEQNRVVTCIVQ